MIRITLLCFGGLLCAAAILCALRARGTGGNERRIAFQQVLLFAILGLPFLVAGAFNTSSSYPQDVIAPSGASDEAPAVSQATGSPQAAVDAAAPPRAASGTAENPADSASTEAPYDYALAVREAQRTAVARYPDLGIADTPLNRAFVTAYRRLQATDPDYLADPQWPIRLADEVAAELAAE